MPDISSSSAQATLIINTPALPAPIPLVGWASNDAFTFQEVKPTQVRMGVDGILSYGYTPYPVPVRFMFQEDSPSLLAFDIWREAMDAVLQVFTANLTIVVPSLRKVWNCQTGTLTSTVPGPIGKEMLDPLAQEITFQKVISAPI